MINSLLQILAYFLLWRAVDQGREEQLKSFGKDWWIVFLLILVAGIILTCS